MSNPNPMRALSVEKINLNIGTGGPGDKMEKAKKLLKIITGTTAVETKTKLRIPTWGVRPGLSLGVRTTLRGKKAVETLKRLLVGAGNKLRASSFDNAGNVAFGIKECLEIPGLKYDPEVGIMGLEVAVTLQRPGFRIRRRSLRPHRIPLRHQIPRDEAITFMKDHFKVEVTEDKK
ncbi:MAG: 50S ribosomal protein L5 [Nanoarchaeota archaeon]|nr:50S ribosomal protein L5 [Nanoarchaeota archaeon]